MALALLGVGAVVAAALLALSGLKDQAAFFYAPTDLEHARVAPDQSIRLGGIVRPGSVARAADGVTTRFVVADQGPDTVAVTYRGILPDLFREGSGVIAEGHLLPGGGFVASTILAKHDEKYMPPPLVHTAAGAMHETRTLAR